MNYLLSAGSSSLQRWAWGKSLWVVQHTNCAGNQHLWTQRRANLGACVPLWEYLPLQKHPLPLINYPMILQIRLQSHCLCFSYNSVMPMCVSFRNLHFKPFHFQLQNERHSLLGASLTIATEWTILSIYLSIYLAVHLYIYHLSIILSFFLPLSLLVRLLLLV